MRCANGQSASGGQSHHQLSTGTQRGRGGEEAWSVREAKRGKCQQVTNIVLEVCKKDPQSLGGVRGKGCRCL